MKPLHIADLFCGAGVPRRLARALALAVLAQQSDISGLLAREVAG